MKTNQKQNQSTWKRYAVDFEKLTTQQRERGIVFAAEPPHIGQKIVAGRRARLTITTIREIDGQIPQLGDIVILLS